MNWNPGGLEKLLELGDPRRESWRFQELLESEMLRMEIGRVVVAVVQGLDSGVDYGVSVSSPEEKARSWETRGVVLDHHLDSEITNDYEISVGE